ncbi:Zinc finger CCHC domain-containing protein 8 [Merluccius polli]|uniref:Zinc finger CCHC domain-containing protein 8 n=1 Tax=Merluccius polli TaxID=89951 RepID=A0AA47MDA0_MERPO|nr:Zinc finger CCHC domain-containing protein 8 [Merluccius polli]
MGALLTIRINNKHIYRVTAKTSLVNVKLMLNLSYSAIKLEDVNTDGPLLQILYANNSISKLCRQEIEDSICNLIQHHNQENQKHTSASQIKPQNSAFVLEEDQQVKTSSGIKKVTEAFKVVGSVLYFTTFSVDKLGQPLLDENPQLTDGWEVPTYQQVFNQVIGTDGQEVEMKERRPKSMCFNCGSSGHQIRDCPKPKDQAAINERRKEFSQGQSPSVGNQRYHAEVEERFAKYKAGLMSEELLSALGVGVNTLPPLIYRMRQLGYPPGWLREAEMENSGLALYDGKDGETTEQTNGQKITYDVSKLVDFPGFNVAASPKMKDEYMLYGSIPMQGNHLKPNFAAYLSSSFPSSDATSNKRRHEPDPTPHQTKKPRSSPSKSSDMDIESEQGTPRRYQGSGGFQFQSPLPPGSPSFSSPPPLPQGTPPATPTPPPLPKGTPPPTPTNGSPALPGRAWVVVDEAGEGAEDGLTLEELEEQQRLIWAALENADTATNSDCETQVTGTSVPSSPSVSTPARVDTETEMDTDELVNLKSSTVDVKEGSESPCPIKSERETPQSPGPIRAQEESPLSPGPIRAQEESPLSPGPIRVQEESPLSPGPIRAQEESPLSPVSIGALGASQQIARSVRAPEDGPLSLGPIGAQTDKLGGTQDDNNLIPGPNRVQADDQNPSLEATSVEKVPHRSRFAAGIVPFEDTPEYTEVAAATGTYLRIRDVLKSSPRNVSRSNK